MSSAVIEVVLGLIFVFFIFSMLCSGINEVVSRALGKRADFLTAGLWSMLDNTRPGASAQDRVEYFVRLREHPLVKQLGQSVEDKSRTFAGVARWRSFCTLVRRHFTGKPLKEALAPLERALKPLEDAGKPPQPEMDPQAASPRDPDPRRLRPSYLPSNIFATVVATFVRETNDLPVLPEKPVEGAPRPPAPLRHDDDAASPLARSLQALVDDAAGDARQLQANLEHWYDAQMERVSGWYKRESKRILLVLAAAVVVLMNVDTLSIARTLWTDPTARQTLADAAQRQIDVAAPTTLPGLGTTTTQPGASTPAPPLALSCATEAPGAGKGTGTTTTTAAASAKPDVVSGALDCARSLPIPLGWRLPSVCKHPGTDNKCGFRDVFHDVYSSLWKARYLGWLVKILGWAITVGALTFGAPFWFDLLNKFGSLRASGAKPKQAAET